MMHELRFTAMDTQVGMWLWSRSHWARSALEAGREMVLDFARRLSRFDPDSELSRLNRGAGKGPQAVSSTLLEVVRLALDHARASAGLFDPTVLGALCRAGYRSPGDYSGDVDYRRVRLGQSTIELPPGMGLDLGGIAKGWIVDRVAEELSRVGPVLVDAGGDLRALGLDWPVAVQDPFHPERNLTAVRLHDQAAATSSIGKRGRHLIDPRIGAPSASDVHTAVVVATTAVEAEIAAKVSLLLGRQSGGRYLKKRGLKAWLIPA